VAFCLAGLALTWRVDRLLRFVFAAYLAALVTMFVVPSAIGENIARLRYAAVPLAVLVLSLRRWRPLALGVVALTLAFSWNLTPLAWSYVHGRSDTSANAATWRTAIAYLRANLEPSYRVEAVDTSTHAPAVYLAEAGIPLARGWYRQDDFPQNELLYDRLGPKAYLRWLHGLGVKYVVLSQAPPDYSARGEADLIRSGRSGLALVFATRELAIYEVPDARPMITGPAAPRLASLNESRIGVVLHAGGTYRIAVRWSPYWHASLGCLAKGSDGMLRLTTHRARVVRLAFHVDAVRALEELAGEQPRCRLP
jgi:hypothetical protein